MEWSADGFPVPFVDTSRCIECGLCVRKCIALEESVEHEDNLDAVESYAAWNRDANSRLMSSSGGVFSALAEYIFSLGGCVFGVVWQDKQTVVFAKARNRQELEGMRGSKYTSALSGYVYREVRDELRAGSYVLFTGTPCQVHALKSFLHKEYEKLLTLDIACHGVPSRLALQKYVKEAEAEQGAELERIAFRDKSTGWANYSYSLVHHYANGQSLSRKQGGDPFMRMFICDAALNVACYNCPYAHLPRQGDISAGDYWGVEVFHADWPVNDGVSSLIVNTNRGKQLIGLLTEKLFLHAEPFQNICRQNKHVYAKARGSVPACRPYVLARLRDERASLLDAISEASDYVSVGRMRLHKDSLLLKLFCVGKRFVRAVLRRLHRDS